MFEEEKYCWKCGAKKSPSFKYCLHCGTKYGEKPKPVTIDDDEDEYEEFNAEESVHNIVKQTEIKKEIEKPPVEKYCPKCGMEIIPEDKYCIECGHRKKNVYIPSTENNNEMVEVKSSSNPIWMVLLVLSIANIALFGWFAVIVLFVAFIVLLVDFADGIIPFILAAGYLALSIYAIKFFSNKTARKRR